MSKRPSWFNYNYPRVIKFLQDREYQYEEYNYGYHLKILGPNAAIELWPSRMRYHYITAEEGDNSKYHSLSRQFNEQELEEIL